jgi:hypothetical protein
MWRGGAKTGLFAAVMPIDDRTLPRWPVPDHGQRAHSEVLVELFQATRTTKEAIEQVDLYR